jgi:hypothetical protein
MTFTSWQFGIFVAAVFGAYYLPPFRTLQVQLLVTASLFFYGYGQPELLPLLAVAVLGTYLFLILALRNRRIWLPVGIAFNLALLAFFKYKLLIVEQTSSGLTGVTPVDLLLKLPLPIGISFFVFHNISLLVDLTRQKSAPPDLTSVFLYIIFFPQLVSGPITRAEMFMPQIKPKYLVDVPFVEASKWILTGFFFKLYVANNLNEMTSLAARLPVRLSNLCRFFRLLGDRDRPCTAVRLSPAGQFQSSIYLDFVFRILDALAHLAVKLVTDLSLHPARRQSPRRAQNLPEFDDCDGAWWALARRRTQLPDVGAVARPAACDRAAVDIAPPVDRLDCLSRSSHQFRLCLRHAAVDILQATELRSCRQLFVGDVRAKYKPEPAEAVL